MAKMFYTLDETKSALGRNEEEIKQFTREGKLREFRDGPRLMFKADQVESLKADIGVGAGAGSAGGGSGTGIGLAPSDSGLPLSLADSKPPSGSGSGISLADTDASGQPGAKEDTALASDLGLGGSVGGVPSPSRSGSMSGSVLGRSASGINVFNPDEVEHADPGAQTSVNPAISDQVNLEGVGSGSGLLDLTRESDDTSLGAELLDEITPTKTRGSGPAAETIAAPTIPTMPEQRGPVARAAGPILVEAPDPTAMGFGAMALGGAVLCLFALFILISGMVGATPEMLKNIAKMGILVVAGGGVAVAVIFFVIGLVAGKVAK
jgi:hypothetical protein